ncbi:hypothetical protein ACQK5W_00800 [Pantoea sp. FN060301]|uniref:hypothetical protein n=1 Tax=Pantoea sp. FN060301 TaxID=3420380 RepID=UPI003D173BCC
MKKVVILLAALSAAGVAQAEEMSDDPAQAYIASLCTIVTQEKAPSSTDDYVAKLRNLEARGTSSSSVEKTPFDEDEARTVVAAWMNLSDEEKQQAGKDVNACRTATLNEYQSQD